MAVAASAHLIQQHLTALVNPRRQRLIINIILMVRG